MTFVGGLNCRDGIVLFADSLETDGYIKRSVNKLFCFQRGDIGNEWGWCIGGTDAASLINKFTDRLVDELPDDGKPLERSEFESRIEQLLEDFQEKHKAENLAFVIGLFSNNPDESRIYRTDGNCLSPQLKVYCIGQDSTLVNFIFSSLLIKNMGVDEGVRLGFLVTSLMAKHGAGVEEPIRVVSCKHGDRQWKHYDPGELQTIRNKVEKERIEWLILNWWEKLNSDLFLPESGS